MAQPKKKYGKHVQWYYAILLAIACVTAYDPSRWDNSAGDTISARYWPVALLDHGTWRLDPFQKDLAGVIYTAIFTHNATVLYPRNGWGMLAFTLPFYTVAHVLNWGGSEWTHDRINHVARWNAIFIATCSVILLFFFLCNFVSIRTALLSSALFAFGTWNWSMATQGLYSQTPAVLTHMIALHVLWRICTAPNGKKVTWLAVLLGMIHATVWSLRPQDMLLVVPAFFALREKKAARYYVLSAACVLIPLAMAYKEVYGFYLGAYGVIDSLPGVVTWRWNGIAGFLGLLFAPNRGALVFFPLLLGVPFFWKKYLPPLNFGFLLKHKTHKPSSESVIPESFARVTAIGAMAYLAVLSFVIYWHGGWAYGARYLYDLLPYVWPAITLMLQDAARVFTEGKSQLPRWALGLCILAGLESVAVHALGHFNYDIYVWNYTVGEVSDKTVWSLKPFILKDTWEAGSNANRWSNSNALKRLHDYGF